jgi:phosphate transport system substrate-binding protein
MTLFQRLIGTLVLITLLVAPAAASAQDSIPVAGSGLASPLFEALISASGASPALTTEVTGTRVGLERLCLNTAQIALTNRAISEEEAAACAVSAVEYLELLLGNYAVTLVGNPTDTVAQCLSAASLNAALAPSAQGQITNWRAVDAANPDLAFTLILPSNDSPAYALLDSVVEGDGLRADATIGTDEAAILDAIASTPGALGLVSYSAAVGSDRVRAFALGTLEGTCVTADASTIASGQYLAVQPLYAYVNRAALAQTGLTAALSFTGNSAAATIINGAGFIAPEADAINLNRQIVSAVQVGRPHSLPRPEFSIPPGVVGTMTVGGDGAGKDYIDGMVEAFGQFYQGVRITATFDGRVAGARKLCNGEVDMIVTASPLNETQTGNCAANNIVPVTVPLGRQAVVMVANAGNAYLQCLTPAQISTIWVTTSQETITTWNQVDATFPSTPMTLLAPNLFNDAADLLFSTATGASAPLRIDAVVNADPLYRAASVAVVDGGLTFMSWAEYERVLEREQANIQLVGVNTGNAGCVAPSLATINDGSYPLQRQMEIIISQTALRRAEVQSFLWYLFSDEQQTRFAISQIIGPAIGDLPDLRDDLQAAYDAAGAAALVPTALPTLEGTPGTPAPTPAGTATP